MPNQKPTPAASGRKRPESDKTITSERSYVLGVGAKDKLPRGGHIFTGPDCLGHQRVSVVRDQQYVGIGDYSTERTSSLSYLSRPPSGSAFPLAKNGRIGEIGWPVEYFGIVKGL